MLQRPHWGQKYFDVLLGPGKLRGEGSGDFLDDGWRNIESQTADRDQIEYLLRHAAEDQRRDLDVGIHYNPGYLDFFFIAFPGFSCRYSYTKRLTSFSAMPSASALGRATEWTWCQY